ncbi:DgyrCDS1037 [Dimorphilus gyrociliatus]|uniref:DgyrCDS1037 n=1 Tax=Dimorphilus gyrociliatus TaxID=2664684 RepID=A0A7I8V844_9ANNE|nr:DgyrCDS1037 [Dimorphilus gyrociliatus]
MANQFQYETYLHEDYTIMYPRVTPTPSPLLPPAKPVTSIPAIVIPVILGTALLVGIFIYIFLYYKRRKRHQRWNLSENKNRTESFNIKLDPSLRKTITKNETDNSHKMAISHLTKLNYDNKEDNDYDTIGVNIPLFTNEDDLGYVEPICSGNHDQGLDKNCVKCGLRTSNKAPNSKQSLVTNSSGSYEKMPSPKLTPLNSANLKTLNGCDDAPNMPPPPIPLTDSDNEYDVLLTGKEVDIDENIYDDPETEDQVIVIKKKSRPIGDQFPLPPSSPSHDVEKKEISSEKGTFLSDVPPPLPPRNLRVKKKKWLGKLKSAKSEPRISTKSLIKKDSKEKEKEKVKVRPKRWSFLSNNDEEIGTSKSKFYYPFNGVSDLESDTIPLSKSMFNLNIIDFDEEQSSVSGYSSCRENVSTDSSFYKESCYTSGDDSSVYKDHNTEHNRFVGSKTVIEDENTKKIKPVTRSVSFPKSGESNA